MDRENDHKESEHPAEEFSKSAPEQNNDRAENLAEASTKLPEINSKEAENPVETSIDLSEMNTGEPENPVEAFAKSCEMNSIVAVFSGEKPTKAESSKKRIVKSLKAKSVIKKKASSRIALDAKKVEGNPLIRQKIKKNRKLSQGGEGGNKNDPAKESNVNAGEEKLDKDVTEIEATGKSQESNKNQEKISGPSSSQHNRRSENNRDGKGKRSRRRNKKGKLDVKEGIKGDENTKDKIGDENTKEKIGDEKTKDKLGDEKKKEKLGGLIFMCSAKTKPDCFRYQVMGMTSSKKDLVLGVRPGLKLFLYDFDLKLMYGVYKASSAGGMRLEPKAFGGFFPIQVRFSVHKDCVPLPESVFKKAIKENYDGKNKFDIELTVQQVRKLSALFRPVDFQSVQPVPVAVHSLSRATNRDREVEKSRDSRSHRDSKTFDRVNVDSRGYPVHSHERERDKQPVQRDVVSTHTEQAPRDLYMSEKEYRTYGLQRERRNLTPRRVASALDPYHRDLEREHLLRQPASPYKETVPRRELIVADPLYSISQTYDYSGRSAPPSAVPSATSVTALDSYTRDPYHGFPHNSSSGNAYVLPLRREEVVSGSSYYVDGRREVYAPAVDSLRGREADEMAMDKLYLKYSVDPPTHYSRTFQVAKPEAVLQPVSARYSFAGPSLSYE